MEPTTTVIADRVRRLRKESGLSQDGLAERMRERGVPWSRAMVINLEKNAASNARQRTAEGARQSVSVQELLALALALDVPPIWLLVDTDTDAPAPLGDDVKLDPWTSLLWMSGQASSGGDWTYRHKPLGALYRVAEIVTVFQRQRQERLMAQALDERWADNRSADDQEKFRLHALIDPLHYLAVEEGFKLPALPSDVIARARELGVQLPGVED